MTSPADREDNEGEKFDEVSGKIVVKTYDKHTASDPLIATIVDEDGNTVENIIDSTNSTTTPLGGGAIFTGTGVNVSSHSNLTIQLFSDQASATNGVQFQFSIDGTNWDISHNFTLSASDGRRFQLGIHAQYFRIVYTNGATPQGVLRIQTIIHGNQPITTIHRLSDDISEDNSATLVISSLTAQKPDGTHTSIDATAGGNLKVSVEEFDNEANPIRKDIEGGGKVSVGTSAVEATFTGTTNSIIITADTSNSGTLYVGKSNVTNTGANAIVFLLPGQIVTIDYDDVDNPLFVVASASSQNFWRGAVL